MNNFSLHSYVSLIDTEGKWRAVGSEEMYQLVNLLINAGMTLNRWIYQVVDLSFQLLLSNTVFEESVGRVFKTVISLYHSLFDVLGTAAFVVALAIIFFVYVFKSPQESFRKLLVLFMVIGINMVIYTNGETYLKDIDTVFDEVEGVLLSGVDLSMEGQGIPEGGGAEKSLQKIRVTYFDRTLRQSFGMVNFGTSIYEDRFDLFLYTDEQENNEQAREELTELVKKESKDNRYMTPNGLLDKWFLSIYAWINNLFVGLPLLFMASMKFLLKILILCMVFILPPVSLLSLIPKFSNVLFSLLGKMMLLFFIGTFMLLAVYIFFFIMTLIDSSIHTMVGDDSVISSILGTVNKAILILVLVKGKGRIINVISAGNIGRTESLVSKYIAHKENSREQRDLPVSDTDSYLEVDTITPILEEHKVDFREIISIKPHHKVGNDSIERMLGPKPVPSYNQQHASLGKDQGQNHLSNDQFFIEKISDSQVEERSIDDNSTTNLRIQIIDSKVDSKKEALSDVAREKTMVSDYVETREDPLKEVPTVEEDKESFYQLLEELRTC